MDITINDFLVRAFQKVSRFLFNKKKQNTPLFFTKEIFEGYKYIIGEHTYGSPKILFENEHSNLFIGRYCSIAEGVVIFLGDNHRTDWITTYPFNTLHQDLLDFEKKSATKGNVVIGHDVWIGFNATILSGITIGNGAVVAAGAVVTKNIPEYEIWGGNPAKFIRSRFTKYQIQRLLEIEWWHWDEEKIKRNRINLCDTNVEDFLSHNMIRDRR